MDNEESVIQEADGELTKEHLDELKNWLFKENIRVTALKNELKEKISETEKKQRELNVLKQSLLSDQKRLQADYQFFEKKMAILQDGFRQLDEDRREFERERQSFEARVSYEQEQRQQAEERVGHAFRGGLFGGVNSLLALKKRYKDLMKIYHPDNLCGDQSMVKTINAEYERMRDEFEYTNIV